MNLGAVPDGLVLAVGALLDTVLEEVSILDLLATVDDTLLLGVETEKGKGYE